MPTYDYECINCSIGRELVMGIDEEHPEMFCYNCGYRMMRLYTSPAVSFKGDGWAGKEKK